MSLSPEHHRALTGTPARGRAPAATARPRGPARIEALPAWLVMSGLALLAVLVGLPGILLRQPSLDEAFVYGLSQHGFGAMLSFWAEDPQALVAQVIAYPFGATAHAMWWLRLPSLLAFGGAAALLWWTARQRFNPGVALGSAALLSIAPLGALHSSDARWPAWALLLGIGTWGCLFRAIDTGDRRWWAAYAAVLTLGVYTNVTILLIVVGQLLPVLWDRRTALRPFVAALVVAGLATVPLALVTLTSDAVNPLFRVPTPALGDVSGMLAKILGGTAPELLRQALLVVVVVLVLVAVLRPRGHRSGPDARAGWLALTWVAAPVATVFVLSHLGDSFWLSRYLIGVLPGACLLVVWAASQARSRRVAVGLACLLAAGMAAGLVGQLVQDDDEPTADWTAAALGARPPGAPVVFFDAEGVQAAGYHSHDFAAADGTPILPGWDKTPVPPGIVLLDNPAFRGRLPQGPPGPALVAGLADRSPTGVVVMVLRPPGAAEAAMAWARANCTVAVRDFDRASVARVSACRAGAAPA